jgi:hypothetical protein
VIDRERYDYFMLRVTRSADVPDRVAGVVERLDTGEKRSFGSSEELVRLVSAWSAPSLNSRAGQG